MIKDRLDEVSSHSNLANIPDESFHLMQDDWRLEISDRMQEIRVKENVSRIVLFKHDSCNNTFLVRNCTIWR